ncbi:beta-lactamase-like protein [Spinellus fusiger]|nr:beta-lactamase-like protein [Spinellus fusiger]
MVVSMDITFLGTGSAQPSATRNHQSMALRLNGDIWLFDCGEATQHQLQKSSLRMRRITRVFITHMHGDHCFGLAPLLCSMTDSPSEANPQAELPPIEIYGPSRLRLWLRTTLKSTYADLGRTYRVHELLLEKDPEDTSTDYHPNELPGTNVHLDTSPQPHYPLECLQGDTLYTVLGVPIQHSIPSLGFIIKEPSSPGTLDTKTLLPLLDKNAAQLREKGIKNPMALLGQLQRTLQPIALPDGHLLQPPTPRPGREIVILGDTCDASSVLSHCHQPHLLVHEATNALTSLDRNTRSNEIPTHEQVQAKAIAHGHSTPQMAGRLGARMQAKKLILTHFSARYRGDEDEHALSVMEEIRALAVSEFGRDMDVYCARDLWLYTIKHSDKVTL